MYSSEVSALHQIHDVNMLMYENVGGNETRAIKAR